MVTTSGQAVMTMLARDSFGLIERAAPKATLARTLCMTPESFSRALAALALAGAIAAAGSSIASLDRGLLDTAGAGRG